MVVTILTVWVLRSPLIASAGPPSKMFQEEPSIYSNAFTEKVEQVGLPSTSMLKAGLNQQLQKPQQKHLTLRKEKTSAVIDLGSWDCYHQRGRHGRLCSLLPLLAGSCPASSVFGYSMLTTSNMSQAQNSF